MPQILCSALLLLIVITTRSQEIPDVQLVLQKLGNGNFNITCVVSENSMDSAITWNEPLSNSAAYALNYVSDYIPNRSSKYNCGIGEKGTSYCSLQWTGASGWSQGHSLTSKLGPVIDKRWEDFGIIYTNGNINFNKFVDIKNPQQFKLHFSVRTQEANMFLCDNLQPYNSNCYWIILSGWEGKKTALRKCSSGFIPTRSDVYPKEPCKTLKIDKTHDRNTILSVEEWKHFTLEKNENNILLWQIEETRPLINYTEDKATIETAHLLMNSRKTPGYWKLHNYFYATTTAKTNARMGPDIDVTENNLCISMFVAMCAKCQLDISLVYYDLNQLTLRSITTINILPIKGLTWQEVKRVIQMPTVPITVYFSVNTDCSNCDHPFWAIDNIQICSENEVRVLRKTQSYDKISCQVIKYPHRQLVQTDVDTDPPAPETTCPNSTFGEACVDCKTVFGDDKLHCEHSIVCEFQSEEQNVCRCAKGYTGTNCEQKCSMGFYGFNCKEQCGHCQVIPCNYLTGKCEPSHCLYSFIGDRCKTAPLPILLNPPRVLEAKPTSFKVQIANTRHEGQGYPVAYILQYREYSHRKWNFVSQYPMTNRNLVEINNLKVLTTYEVRAILVDETGQIYELEYVPKKTVATTCAFIEDNGIIATTLNTSVTLVFLDNVASCPPEDYEVMVNGRKITSDTYNFRIDNLTRFTVYTVEIKSTRSNDTLHYQFQTEDGEPSKVQEIVTSNEATNIFVSWKPPAMPNGSIRYYKVQYEHVRYNSCNKGVKKEDSRRAFEVHNDTSITLENLLPYSQYRIKVAAVTIMEGKYDTTYTNTKATKYPEENEIPRIRSTQPGSSSVEIFLQQPDCTLIKGPVQYCSAFLICSDDWCLDTYFREFIYDANFEQPIKIENLLPYSNYSVTINVKRLNGDVYSGTGMTARFTTKSSVPNTIKDLVAYSRDESSIFLRWLPPYPPTGTLSEYSAKYCYKMKKTWRSEDVCNTKHFKVTECRLWKSRHCIELHQLERHQNYTINVYAKNLDTHFNKPTSTDVETKQDAPDIPEKLSATWDDYYNFSLTWNHPSITNGPLTKFIIKIYPDVDSGLWCYTSEYKVTEETYNLTYTFVIPLATSCLSSKLTVYVSAFNIIEGPSTKMENLFSPPKTPAFENPPSVQNVSNTTILIELPPIKDVCENSIGYIFVATNGVEEQISPNSKNAKKIWERVNIPSYPSKWIAEEYNLRKGTFPKSFLVGNNTKSISEQSSTEIYNKPLQASTNYMVIILLVNEFEGIERYSVYKLSQNTTGGIKEDDNQSSMSSYFALFALLPLLLIALWLLVRHYKKTRMTIPRSNMLGIEYNTEAYSTECVELQGQGCHSDGMMDTRVILKNKVVVVTTTKTQHIEL